MKRSAAGHRGYTLLELTVAVGIFMIIAGAAFELLIMSQQRQKTELQLLDSFQAARLSLDQVVRDVSNAGYPPPSFSTNPASSSVTASPFAWDAGYPTAQCQVNSTCVLTPSPTDLIIEANFDPSGVQGVHWVRYALQGTTLYRADVPKIGNDPVGATQNFLVPYVQNVVNLAPPNGGAPVDLFTYDYDSFDAMTFSRPGNILDVNITLVVMSKDPDMRTGQPRVAELNGRARRINLGFGGASSQVQAFPPPVPGGGGGG